MSSLIRKTVSKKKRRYQKNGFDLDLSYITDSVIAMGFPSESVEGVYRNPFKEVFRFLEQMHKDHYKVYNLCSERGYDIQKFHNRVEVFPFDDHNCPPLEMILKFCKNVQDWLKSHEKNVVVIHCKAGKGRTGLMICSYMLYSGAWKSSQDALDFYAAMRTYNKKGVTIPSQIRYVTYFADVVTKHNQVLPDQRPLLLNSISLIPTPKIPKLLDIRFSVYVNKTLIFAFKDPPTLKSQKSKKEKEKDKSSKGGAPPSPKLDGKGETDENSEDSLVFECGAPVPLLGDIKIDFYEKNKDRIFAFWFNTGFIDHESNVLEIKREELDKANKDKSGKTFKDNFRVICTFNPLEVDTKQLLSSSNNSINTESKSSANEVLNGSKTFSSTTMTTRSACEVSEDLLKQVIEVVVNNESVITTENQLNEIKDSNAFKAFAISTCELQQVVVNELSHDERLCFWINTYNLLGIHSNVIFNPPSSKAASLELRSKLSKKAKYNIGGLIYSMEDIEFIILRSRMTIPEQFGAKIVENDQRNLNSLSRAEPRINFALNCGTESSPIIKIFHSSTVFEELERATTNFLTEKITIDNNTKEITVPKVLEWYLDDFAKTPQKLLKTLMNYLSEEQKTVVQDESYQIKFQEYNWNFYYSFKHYAKEESD